MDDFRAGIEARLSKSHDPQRRLHVPVAEVRRHRPPGRRSRHSSAAGMRTALSPRSITFSRPRVSVGGEYEVRHAIVGPVREFDLRNALGTVDWRLDQRSDALGRRRDTRGWRPIARSRTAAAPAFRVSLTALAPGWPGTSVIDAPSCRRSGLAARSRTRNSRPASSDRSRAVSTGVPARRCVKPIR